MLSIIISQKTENVKRKTEKMLIYIHKEVVRKFTVITLDPKTYYTEKKL